jgi:MerR family transcriptional regulator, copper efflux regulator
MRIGKVAQEAGVNIQTLRYYERRALIPNARRLASGYREYDPATVPLVRFIKNAQELGFTLREIGELIELREDGPHKQSAVRDLATRKILDIDRRIFQLQTIKGELAVLLVNCKGTGSKDCVILEAMDGSKGERQLTKRKSSNGRNHGTAR